MSRPHLSDELYQKHFWDGVTKDESGCWTWKRSKLHHGHGQFFFKGRRIQAHRYAYLITHGAIPPGKWILHTCDNGSCVRPDHLYAGNQHDNEQDKINRNRTCRGVKNGTSKLNEAQVIEIKDKLLEGHKLSDMRDIAKLYNVSWQTIYAIHSGRKWGWLTCQEIQS